MNIVFVVNVAFPYGQALSSRVRHFAALLCSCGHHVHVIAPLRSQNSRDGELSQAEYSVQYVKAPETTLTLAGIGTAKPYMQALAEYTKHNQVDMILSSSMVFVTDKIRRFANKHCIPYVIEQCEWYDPSTYKLTKWNPHYREHIRLIEKKNKHCDGVIGISRLLTEHYRNQGVRAIRIPTILDIQSTECALQHDDRVCNIVFAGSLGKGKENIAPILQAIALLGEAAGGLHFHIYGANEAQVLNNIGNDQALMEKVRPYFTAYGRIPQQEVEEKFRSADYSIFIRPDRRSSHAGFPTKLAESMAVGTPVITNDTGDIGLYLKDGDNGFLLQEGTAQVLAQVFRRILQMDAAQHTRLREGARRTAEEAFDYRIYQKQMEDFLNQMR